ncbi:MAG: hypothetical protein EBS05_24075 [Proteobacteria bacterium]|nr:hypothetical protein [Pseudomonadota bacterium]
MKLEYEITFVADFSGLDATVARLNEVQRIQEAQDRLDAALLARRLNVLEAQGNLNALRKQESELAARAVAAEQAGRTGEAASLNLQVLQTRERIEKLVTAEKQKQFALDREAQQQQFQRADKQERDRTSRVMQELKKSQKADPEQKLFGIGQENAEAVADALPGPVGASVSRMVRLVPKLGPMAGPVGAGLAAKDILDMSIANATEIKHQSEQTGLSPEEVQRLGRAAQSTGLEFNDFASALDNLSAKRREAAEGNDDARETFKHFGISLADLQDPAVRHIDLLQRIAAQNRNLTETQRTEQRDLLGRRSEQIGQAMAGAQNEGGPVVSKEDIERLDEMGKRTDRFFGDLKTYLTQAAADWLKLGEAFATIAMGEFGIKTPGMSNETRDRRAYVLDQQAIDEGAMAEGQSPRDGHTRYAAFLKNKTDMRDKSRQATEVAEALDQDNKPAEAKAARQRALQFGRAAEVGYDDFQVQNRSETERKAFTDKAAESARKKEALDLEAADYELVKKQQALAFSLMSTEEKRAELKRRMAELDTQIGDEGTTQVDAKRLEAQKIDLQMQLNGMKDAPAQNEPARDDRLGVSATALQRIGGFTGGLGGTDPTHVAQAGIAALQSGNRADAQNLFTLLRNGVVVTFK